MFRTMILPIVVLVTFSAVPFSSLAAADEDSPPQNSPETEEPDLEVQSLELNCKMAELAISQAELAVARVTSRLQAAGAKEDRDEIEWLELDLKEASLELQIRKLQLEISQLQLDRAKKHQQHREDAEDLPGNIMGPVQIEYLEGVDGIVLRGSKSDVERVAKIIQDLESGLVAREPTADNAEPSAAEAGFLLNIEGPDKASVAESISVTCTLTTTQDHPVSGNMSIEYSESLKATAASSGFKAGIPPLVWPTEEIAAGGSRQWSVKLVCDKPDADAAVKFTFSPRDGQKVTETLKLNVQEQ